MSSRGAFEIEPEIEGATIKVAIEKSEDITEPEIRAVIKLPSNFTDEMGHKLMDQLGESPEAAQIMGALAMLLGDPEKL
jgi:hypothetical protein